MSDTLWDWSSKAYAAPGVASACLHLQDVADQNVPLLLWAAWVAQTGRRPEEDDIEAACDTARAWAGTTVSPLRAIRRTLKAPIPDMDDAAREAVRDQIKAVELLAERKLLEALEALAPAPSGAPRRAIEGLVETARLWARVVPRPALVELSAHLPE
jgi:uncharacterized protein (TIGR02444 family)